MSDKNTNDNIHPWPGRTLHHTLRGHSDWIARIAWSPDGKIIASPSVDKTVRLWDAQTGQPFAPTKSTHGRRVWTFDARSETDPFAGVYHWDRALRQAQHMQGNSPYPLKKFLVAARIDRGGRSVSPERIESLVRDLGFDGYFETSAKEDIGITELAEAMKQAIDWAALPKVTSNDLFQQIKAFLITEKEAGHLLSTTEDLYRTFLNTQDAPADTGELRAQFETCIGRVESQDLIIRLNLSWQRLLEKQIKHIKTVVVFVGKDGIGPWQQKEVEAFLIKFANRKCPVIPVLLPDAPKKPRLPIFLETLT